MSMQRMPMTQTDLFFAELLTVAPSAGNLSYRFLAPDGGCRGFVQIIDWSSSMITIHRLWTLDPGKGNGGWMLRKLCEIADRHGVTIRLKATPFGRKPYPRSREELRVWYERHGFQKRWWKLIREPRAIASRDASSGDASLPPQSGQSIANVGNNAGPVADGALAK